MKSLLVRTGRGGCWSGFLREQNIPGVTADRYVGRHELVLHPETENRPTEALSETELIQNLVRSVLAKVQRAVKTGGSSLTLIPTTRSHGAPSLTVQETFASNSSH
jgi:hypothetical protein